MLEIAFLVQKPGEMDLDTTVNDDYVGGQPAGVTANGKLALLKAVTAVGFVGLFRNDKAVDAANGKVTYLSEISEVILKPSVVNGSNVYPYAEAFSAYAPKDQLFINSSGLFTRTKPGATSPLVLLVLKKVDGEGLYCQIKSVATGTYAA